MTGGSGRGAAPLAGQHHDPCDCGRDERCKHDFHLSLLLVVGAAVRRTICFFKRSEDGAGDAQALSMRVRAGLRASSQLRTARRSPFQASAPLLRCVGFKLSNVSRCK
jgi:hypothetical protein